MMGIATTNTLTRDSASSNGESDKTLGPQVLIISAVFASLATLAVAGRLWARKVKRVRLGGDDWMAVVALVRIAMWVLFLCTALSLCSLVYGKRIQIERWLTDVGE